MTRQLQILSSNKFLLGTNSLSVNGPVCNDEWVNAFKDLSSMSETTQWWLGDLLNEMEAAGKDILSTIGDEVGYDHRSMQHMKRIASTIPKDKRVDGCSWSHHREAYSETKNLDAMVAELTVAKTNNLSVLAMRADIREKLSDMNKTTIPAVTHSKESVLFTEALNGITAIKRFVNNGASKVTEDQKAMFLSEFDEVATLIDEELE